MTTTTDEPTYPLPPRPLWQVDDPRWTVSHIAWSRLVGHADGFYFVEVGRNDMFSGDSVTAGLTSVHVEIYEHLAPSQARELALALIEAAALAEQS